MADGTSRDLALRAPSPAPSRDGCVTEEEVTQGLVETIPYGDYLRDLGDYAQLKIVCMVSLDGSGVLNTATAFPELVLDLPKGVSLSVTMAATDKHWVLHTSPAVPSLNTRAGYLAVTADEGPTALASLPTSPTILTAKVISRDTKTAHDVRLRARRLWERGYSYGMNNYFAKTGATEFRADTYFRLQCLAADNQALPAGTYTGRLVLQWTGFDVQRVFESIFVDIDLTVPRQAVVAPEPGAVDDPPAPSLYPTPVVREVRARNALDRRDIDRSAGATITVEPWEGIVEGQRIWLRCEGSRTEPSTGTQAPDNVDLLPSVRTVSAAEVIAGITASLPFEYVDRLGDYGQLRVVFKAAIDGGDNESTATPFPALVLDVPKCVDLSVTTAATEKEWVEHTSPATPWIPTQAGYLALSEKEGPTALASNPPSPTTLRAVVTPDGGKTEFTVHLRARRLWEGSVSYGMNNYTKTAQLAAYSGRTFFRIQCLVADNAELPSGTYTGKLVLQLTGMDVPRVLESLFVVINITV